MLNRSHNVETSLECYDDTAKRRIYLSLGDNVLFDRKKIEIHFKSEDVQYCQAFYEKNTHSSKGNLYNKICL